VKIALRAGLIVAPISGAIALMATLNPLTAVVATLLGGVATGAFFGVADWLGRRSSEGS
jgi:uncharacterized membrane protein